VRVNRSEYAFIRYRCDYCGTEWHTTKAFEQGLIGCERIAPKNANVLCEALTLRDWLQHWGGKVVEFLDNYEGSFEEDELAIEALALQRSGLKLGLVRVFQSEKRAA